jgi:hypothetical protein
MSTIKETYGNCLEELLTNPKIESVLTILAPFFLTKISTSAADPPEVFSICKEYPNSYIPLYCAVILELDASVNPF